MNQLRRKADIAIRASKDGDLIEAYEERTGQSMTSSLDCLWDDARAAGDAVTARRLERAFNRLPGRD